jgi:argininosuccinate synthase
MERARKGCVRFHRKERDPSVTDRPYEPPAGAKVVLAYSGGLDTSVLAHMLASKGYEVHAVLVDVGQGEDLSPLRDKALRVGATGAHVVDAREEFAEEFVLPSLEAHALYEGKYPLFTALSRYVISRHLVRIAREVGARAIAHGSTGKGNDQVRFEVATGLLAPDLTVMAPIRDWKLSRDQALAYAAEHGIPVPVTKKSPYSIDFNLWGRSVECGILEDPWEEPPADAYYLTADPREAPDEPEYLTITFERGRPVALDGRRLPLVDLIGELTKRAGRHGVGRVDMVESRLVGIKSREIYEVPAAAVLIAAHEDLESLTLERELFHYKKLIEAKYAEQVYYGLWFAPLREALQAFVEETQQYVNGEVRVRLYKGTCVVVGRRSPNSLYDASLATYEAGDTFAHEDARGFVNLWGLPSRVFAAKNPRDAGKERGGSEA